MDSSTRQKAFVQMMDQHKKLIYKICAMYCPEVEDRQDLMQEIAVQLWKAMPSYDNRYKQSIWLYRVALNTAISFYRKTQRQKAIISPMPESLMSIEEEAKDQFLEEKLQQLQSFIQELDELNKALMILYLDRNNYREIATILGISETNVATKINRIKQKLKKKFQALNPNES